MGGKPQLEISPNSIGPPNLLFALRSKSYYTINYMRANLYSYPYVCSYLWHLLHIEQLSTLAISRRVAEMEDWLRDNCTEITDAYSNTRLFIWSSNIDPEAVSTMFSYSVKVTPTRYDFDNANTYIFPNYIAFREQSDLLAFRLRWGINDTYDRA